MYCPFILRCAFHIEEASQFFWGEVFPVFVGSMETLYFCKTMHRIEHYQFFSYCLVEYRLYRFLKQKQRIVSQLAVLRFYLSWVAVFIVHVVKQPCYNLGINILQEYFRLFNPFKVCGNPFTNHSLVL